jgi:hypothetical protein
MTEFSKAEWERAQVALNSARHFVESDPDAAGSRAYYAAFYGLTAFFALRGQHFTKHSSIRAALHRDLVHQGIIDEEAGKEYDLLMDARETGDYGGAAHVTEKGARAAVDMAARFLAAVERACPDVAKID